MDKNLILIGMPGAGKTTLGRLLAKRLSCPFIDTDELIEQKFEKTLQQLLDEHGYMKMRDLEAQTICQFTPPAQSVIATGGSAVYSNDAMQHLKQHGICIYLAAQPTTITKRVKNITQRGFNAAPGMSLEAVYKERLPLYQKYADVTAFVDQGSEEQTLNQLLVALMGYL